MRDLQLVQKQSNYWHIIIFVLYCFFLMPVHWVHGCFKFRCSVGKICVGIYERNCSFIIFKFSNKANKPNVWQIIYKKFKSWLFIAIDLAENDFLFTGKKCFVLQQLKQLQKNEWQTNLCRCAVLCPYSSIFHDKILWFVWHSHFHACCF